MILSLPYPPTGNHTTKHSRGGHYSTQAARSYLSHVSVSVAAQNAASAFSGPLAVVCEVFPPDARRRDMDNTWKTLADALTHAGVWIDDSQISDLRLVRGEVRAGGMVVVSIEEVGGHGL